MSSITGLISGGGGAGTPINGIKSFNLPITTTQFTDSDGSVWLRNGTYLTSGFSTYPDAVPFSDFTKANQTGSKVINYAGDNPEFSYASRSFFSESGTKWIVTPQFADNAISEYTLSTPFDIDTATLTRTRNDWNAMSYNRGGVTFNSTGSVAYAAEGNDIRRSNCTSFNVSTLSFSGVMTGAANIYREQLHLSSNGLYIYGTSNVFNQVWVARLNTTNGTSFVSQTVYSNTFSFPSTMNATNPYNNTVRFSSDGLSVYFILKADGSGSGLYFVKYQLTSAYDLSNPSYVAHTIIPGHQSSFVGLNSNITGLAVHTGVSSSVPTNSYTFPNSIGLAPSTDTREFLRIK